MEQYQLYVNSLRAPETKRVYTLYFEKYREFMGTNDLFCGNNPRLIENKIIEYIILLKEKGMAFYAISNYVSSVLAFYKINDVLLNTTKIGKFLPEQRKVKKDRGYEDTEIYQLLNFVDERYRVIVLILASTGIRIGALPELRKRHLEKMDNVYKFTIYENANEEYITFCTPECATAIDNYFEMRQRYGESVTSDSLLIREQFDSRSRINKKQKQLKSYTITRRLIDLLVRCGVRTNDVKVCHGFRKFFTTQLVNAKINPEIREILLGHKIGLASAYYRPTEQEMYQEYEKAINNLTINEENRLKEKVEYYENRDDAYSLQITEKIINRLREKGINV